MKPLSGCTAAAGVLALTFTLNGCDQQPTDGSDNNIDITPRVIRAAELATTALTTSRNKPDYIIKASYKPDSGFADSREQGYLLPYNKTAHSPQLGVPHAAVIGTTFIPYPLYPNATQYRIGGEGELKIVLFETEDAFYKVDAFYRNYIENVGLSRLLAMSDYVRYAAGNDDFDPWATDQPGIVIHEFPDAVDARRLGARDGSKTNIIMSF